METNNEPYIADEKFVFDWKKHQVKFRFSKTYWIGGQSNLEKPSIETITSKEEFDFFKTSLHESERRIRFVIPVTGLKYKTFLEKLMFWKK